jgi:hypothetical protein
MSLKRLQNIIEYASMQDDKRFERPKLEARILIRDDQIVVGVEALRDGEMQFIPGVATQMYHPYEPGSQHSSIDEMCSALIDDLAVQALKSAADAVPKKKGRN